MTKGEGGGQKSQKIDDVFYERPLCDVPKVKKFIVRECYKQSVGYSGTTNYDVGLTNIIITRGMLATLASLSSRRSESQNCCLEVAFIISRTLFRALLWARSACEAGNFSTDQFYLPTLDQVSKQSF